MIIRLILLLITTIDHWSNKDIELYLKFKLNS